MNISLEVFLKRELGLSETAVGKLRAYLEQQKLVIVTKDWAARMETLEGAIKSVVRDESEWK